MNNVETRRSKNQHLQDTENNSETVTIAKEVKDKERQAIIICGFPGIGKSSLFSNKGELEILDSDSTHFSWSDETKTQRHPDWPQNYIEHIKDKCDKSDVLLVSSHDVIRQALTEAGIHYTLVYPALEMKEEYIQRYIQRGSNKAFIRLLEAHYENWITELMNQQGCIHLVLKPGQYLSDVVHELLLNTFK